MKNNESYPPLKAVELANQKMPEIWDAIEKTRVSMLKQNLSLWREDIYIPAWQIYESTFLNGPYHIPKEARPRALAVVLSILSSWRQYKEVYRFAPEMENLLYQQADFNLPAGYTVIPSIFLFLYRGATNMWQQVSWFFHRI